MRMKYVSYEQNGHIAILRLIRPEKRNAISDAMIAELGEVVERARREAKAAVVAAEGNHFCAGLDLVEHAEKTAIEGIEGSRRWHEVFTRMQRGPIPFICALQGAVVGGGLELASCTHVRVADKTAFFALPEGKRGIFVGGGGSVNVSRLMGVTRMTDLMLTGRVLSAEEAERIGVVTYLTPAGDAFEKALELARTAAENAPLSNYAIVNALQRIHDSGHEEGLFFESMIASFTQTTPDAAERLKEFIDKKAARLDIPAERPADEEAV